MAQTNAEVSLNLMQRGISRTPSFIRTSSGGSVSKGIRSVTFFNAGATNATVLGTVLKTQEKITIDAGGQGDHLDSIEYDGTGTDLVIVTIQ